ncbi:MAG: hypothetical protein M1831_003328 [Alyxoria varia]|nr:MAG: hypothetical protein M1831_003328 [Alyxoria varia]
MQTSRRSAATPAASATTTTTASDPSNPDNIPAGPTLRLRGADSNTRERGERNRRVQWAEDVVDNEGMGKKKSKVCCIYHKPRAAGESSSEDESSSSDSDSDSDGGAANDDGSARPGGRMARNRQMNDRVSEHGDHCANAHAHDRGVRGRELKGKDTRKPSPNAYEKQPKAAARSTKN